MYRTIEELWPTHTITMPDGDRQVPAVVEDADGVRILLVGNGPDTARLRANAVEHGVGMVVVCSGSGDDRRYQAGLAPDFDLTDTFGQPPAYRDLVVRRAADEQRQASTDPLDDTDFVHLHTHFEFSLLDGLSTVPEGIEQITKHGQVALGITDHGNVAGHPSFDALCRKAGVKPVLGMEAYLVPDRHRRGRTWLEVDGREVSPDSLSSEDQKKAERRSDSTEALNEYWHVTLWAETDQGLRNLWAMSTESYREGFYGKPRLDWDILDRLGEGVICGTGCLRGPVARPLAQGQEDQARQHLMRLHHIFGDRLYIEMHTNHLDEQVLVNRVLADWSREYQIPPLACVDSHYATPDHQQVHRAWLAMQTNQTLADDTALFGGEQDYHLSSGAEVAEALSYLPPEFVAEAMANTVQVARRCDAHVGGSTVTPIYSRASEEHPDPEQRDLDRVYELIEANWERKVRSKSYPESAALERVEREMLLLRDKHYLGYYLVVWDYVSWVKRNGGLVGPGRGSGGGSMVAYLLDITEIDPIENNLLFERFLTEGRTSLPDFDIDFATSWRDRLMDYLVQRWGADHVSSIGTVLRMQSKLAVNDAVRVLKGSVSYDLPYLEFETLRKAIDAAEAPLAGMHLPWEDFCAQHPELVDPMRASYPEVMTLIDATVGRVKTFGKHAAGVVISTDRPLTDLPMRLAGDRMVTQFDMGALELLGYVKFDLLTLRTLDTIQTCVDLVEKRLGVRVDPYSWVEQYRDAQVWAEIAEGRTLGLFQIETRAGTRLVREFQPTSVADLAAINTLVRPGPTKAGLTAAYLRRRAGVEPITYPHPLMAEVLDDTYGTIIYQEQVMAATMLLANYDTTEADEIRSILGKKKVEKAVPAGREFVRRAVDNGIERDVAERLWEQMAEFTTYSFNRAHAYAYAVLGYWTAWLKVHHPVPFLTAALSTVKAERLAEFVVEARRMGYGVLGPDVNRSAEHFVAEQTSIRYGLADIKGIGEPTARAVVAAAPFDSLDDFVERLVKPSSTPVDAGTLRTLVEAGAFDSLVDNRRAVEAQLEREASGEAKRCVHKAETLNEHNLPCVFDWANEPDPPTITRGRGKNKQVIPKPPPARCTVACRNYTKPPPLAADQVEPYTADEIREKEKALLGIWLSSTPFDRCPDLSEVADALDAIEAGPLGSYVALALPEQIKEKIDKTGRKYAWLTLRLPTGTLDAVCFASTWEQARGRVSKDGLAAVMLDKTPRGYNVTRFDPIA